MKLIWILILIGRTLTLQIETSLHQLTRECSSRVLRTAFATFVVDMDNLQMVHLLLTAPGVNIRHFFEFISESPYRSILLLRHVNCSRFHHSVFSLSKLDNNPELARALFLSATQYDGNLLSDHPPRIFRFLLCSMHIQQSVLRTALRQVKQMDNLEFFESLNQHGNRKMVSWMFEALKGQMELTPTIMRTFTGPCIVDLVSRYLSDRVTLVERRFRVANALLAAHDGIFESRLQLERLWLEVRTLFGIDGLNGLDFAASKSLFYALLSSIVGFENRHSWGVIAALLLHTRMLDDADNSWTLECIGWLLYRTSDPLFLPPYLTRSLLKSSVATFDKVSYLPSKYLSLNLLPLEERRLLWFRNGPLRVFLSNRLFYGSSLQRYLILQIANCFDIPINLCYHGCAKPTLPLSSIIIAFAKLSKVLSEPARRDILVGVVPYLLADSRQINLVLFEGQSADEEWEQFYSRVAIITGSEPNYLRTRFALWKIEKYFSPVELKSLIHTDHPQDQNSSADIDIRLEFT